MTTEPSGEPVRPDVLRTWVARLLTAAGATEEAADRVAESLVESELRGYATHGVLRLPGYVAAIRDGVVDPQAAPLILGSPRAATVVVDGRNGFGQVTAAFAADVAATRAAETGVAVVVARGCRHVGRLGEFVERLADRGFAGFAAVSAEPYVAGPGGGGRVIGTNPLAWGFPAAPGEAPVVVDFATSAVSAGRVFAAAARGEQIPEGWIVDATGNPSRQPGDLAAGGALAPLAGHKGFALAVVADLLAGVLSGAGPGAARDGGDPHGLTIVAIDVAALTTPGEFGAGVSALRERVTAAGARLPGEGAAARRESLERAGVRIPAATARELDELAASLGLPPLA